jgi:broad specificity phosphatase PhoE
MSKARGLMTALRSATIAVAALCAIGAANASEVPNVPPGDLIERLKAGGYVIYLRHAQTEKDYADQVSAVPGQCDTQRMLSEAGWRQAKTIGAAIAVHGVPVGEVYSSEYCRSWQTAEIAFGRHVKRAALNFEPAEEYTPEQTAAMRDRVRPMLVAAPSAGFNTVIVAHDDPFEAATGHYPEPQGVSIIVQPDGQGGFTLVGRLGPDDWLATPAQAAPPPAQQGG